METATYHDLKLVGTTSSVGGQFRHIKITGECVMSDDVICDSLKCTGEFEIEGDLQVKQMKLTGESHVHGRIHCDSLKAIGAIKAYSIRGSQVNISGHLKVETNCEAETLKLHGWLEAGELISAEKLDMILHGPCRALEIGGGTITVKRSQFSILKSLLTIKEAGTLQANVIEGDVLNLEHVRADVVRGTRITIGTGCTIGRVEYRESLIKHPKADIASEIRI